MSQSKSNHSGIPPINNINIRNNNGIVGTISNQLSSLTSQNNPTQPKPLETYEKLIENKVFSFLNGFFGSKDQ